MIDSSTFATLLLAAVLPPLVPVGANAQVAEPTMRSFLQAKCGVELAAYEDAVPQGQSVWQGKVGKKTLDEPNQKLDQVVAWGQSIYPVIDALVLTRSSLRDQRNAVATWLGRAIELTNCLTPDQAQLDAYVSDGPRDAAEVIASSNCVIEAATVVHEAMMSGMDSNDLRIFAVEKMDQISACEASQ